MNTQIIAIANQKGGVGKTTTCANLGIGLAQAGRKVLLIDGDPQGSLTISLGHSQPDKLPFTLSDAMGHILMDEPLCPGEGILHHPEGVDLMPADIQLSGMEVSLVNSMSRETILRQYLDTLKGQYSHRPTKENCSQVGNDFGKKSSELLAEQVGQSKNQIFRYIRLTELIPELLNMVDERKIALNPAYELSFLKKEEQTQLLDAMDSEQATPSLSQAQRLKKFSQEGHLSIDVMRVIMGEEKKSDLDKVTFTSDTLRKYFPKSYTPQRMQETIIKLLEQWQKKRQQQHER